MRIFRNTVVPRLFHFSLAVVIFLLLAATALAAGRNTLWQSGDQFVALEPQDSLPVGSAKPNDHPVRLTGDRLTSILASLKIRTSDGDNPEPLFSAASVLTIAPHLLQGLMEASPTEDVTFAIIGLHDTLYGLAKSPKVTTGRVFYQAGRLNIIIGLAHQDVRDREDRRLFPFTPGGRQKALKGNWKFLPQPEQKGYRLERNDWVAFNDDWRAPVAEQILPATPATSAQPAISSKDSRTPAERLTTLKELSDKGLITADEYRIKRQEILEGL
jgi:hypothetical protein